MSKSEYLRRILHTHTHTHTHTYKHIRTHTHTYAHIQTHTHTYKHIQTHTHTYKHIRTYTNTRIRRQYSLLLIRFAHSLLRRSSLTAGGARVVFYGGFTPPPSLSNVVATLRSHRSAFAEQDPAVWGRNPKKLKVNSITHPNSTVTNIVYTATATALPTSINQQCQASRNHHPPRNPNPERSPPPPPAQWQPKQHSPPLSAPQSRNGSV